MEVGSSIWAVLKCLNWLPRGLYGVADRLVASYDSPVFDEAWQLYNSMFKLPQGFLQKHYSLDFVESCDERLLPKWPACPDPLARNKDTLLVRPDANELFLESLPVEYAIYTEVIKYGVPNYRGAPIPVNKNVNATLWEHYLRGYDDLQVIEFMAFGWPSGYESKERPMLGLSNHPSSLKHMQEVQKYLNKEKKFGAIWGPFDLNPFRWFVSIYLFLFTVIYIAHFP